MFGKKHIRHVNQSLLILKQLDHNLTIKELNFNHATFWIQAHGIHFDGLTSSDAQKLAYLITKLVEIDEVKEDLFLVRNSIYF